MLAAICASGGGSVLFFLTLSFVLELLHGFKAGLYLDVSNETRRLMWTLAHAHGALLGLVHVIFALSLRVVPEVGSSSLRLISSSLIGASVLLPGGFFLGGVDFFSGDPGLGIVVVPVGAALLMIAVYLIVRGSGSVGVRSTDGPKNSKGRTS